MVTRQQPHAIDAIERPKPKTRLNPKTETGDKPQIAQISQMTEAKEFSADGSRDSTGTKKFMARPWLLLF